MKDSSRGSFCRRVLAEPQVLLFLLVLYASHVEGGDLQTYGATCRESIGVPVPAFRCDDPRATEIDPGRNSGGCRTPSHGSSGCDLGTRFLRFDDEFTDETGRRHVVNTMIMCRGRRAPGSSSTTFHDIAVIQHNQTNNAACWFSRQGQSLPASVPSPNDGANHQAAQNFWGGSQPNMDCRSCHDNGTYMRSPFAALVPAEENGKGYRRTGRTGDYEAGNGNGIPRISTNLARQGAFCSVGTQWNDRATYPEIKIDTEAYLAYQQSQGVEVPAPQRGVNVGYCTSCHYVGATFSCRLVNDSTGHNAGGSFSRRFPTSFPNGVWMPPRDRLESLEFNVNPANAAAAQTEKQRYDEVFGPAITALRTCCDNPGLTTTVNGETRSVCGARFTSTERQRTLSERGACALLEGQRPGAPRTTSSSGGSSRSH